MAADFGSVDVLDLKINPLSLGTKTGKVAIVGGGPSRRRAPFTDPTWEIWAFSSRRWHPPKIDRWFELHAITDLKEQLAAPKRGRRTFRSYMRFIRNLECPVYMQRVHPDIPTSVVFPIDDLIANFGRAFTSTASFMIAFAIMQQVETIGLWGINPRSGNYARQRPAIEYFLGVARQRGIDVYLPPGSSLRAPMNPEFIETPVLYAYDWRSREAWWRRRVRRRARRR